MKAEVEMEKDQKPKLTIRQRKWLDAYLETLNATEAAKRAGYRCKTEGSFRAVGCQNLTTLNGLIRKWISDVGLSEEKVKLKIIEGLDAKETKFFAHEGKVTDRRDVQAWAIQAKFTEMAAKVLTLFDSDLVQRVEKLEQALAQKKGA